MHKKATAYGVSQASSGLSSPASVRLKKSVVLHVVLVDLCYVNGLERIRNILIFRSIFTQISTNVPVILV